MAINRQDPVVENAQNEGGVSVNVPLLPGRRNPAFDTVGKTLKDMKIVIDGENGIRIDEKALKAVPQKDIRILQTRLSNENIYVPEESPYYADGKIGGLTTHALALAADENFAVSYISEQALRDKKLDSVEIMKLQASLNRLGYDSGELDGKFGKKTATAIQSFLEEHPEEAGKVDPSLKKMLSGKLGKGAMADIFHDASAKPGDAAADARNLPTRTVEGHALLRPELLEFVEQHPGKRAYIEMAFDAADKYGLDPRMFANQIYQESNRLDPHAKGIHTRHGQALGITQMMPGTAREYGLSKKDLLDPKKAIDAAAHHMADLTKKNGGSQEMALIEYNGGGKAIKVVERALKTNNITVDDWMDFMEQQRERHGTGDRNKWRVQTYEYVKNVVPDFWDKKQLQKALAKPENRDTVQETPEKPEPVKQDNAGPAYADNAPLSRYMQSGITLRAAAGRNEPFTPAVMSKDFGRAAEMPVMADLGMDDPSPTKPKGPAFTGQTLG